MQRQTFLHVEHDLFFTQVSSFLLPPWEYETTMTKPELLFVRKTVAANFSSLLFLRGLNFASPAVAG